MIIKFTDWNVLEARTYSDEKFEWITKNIGGWIVAQAAEDPKFKARLQGLEEFRNFQMSREFTLDSAPEKVRAAMSGFENYLNTISSRSSNGFIKEVTSLSSDIKQKILSYGRPVGLGTGKRGRPAGSKNKPRVSEDVQEEIRNLELSINGHNNEIMQCEGHIKDNKKRISGAQAKIKEMTELISKLESSIDKYEDRIATAKSDLESDQKKLNKLKS